MRKGCGKGYDVAMLALHGFDVYGLEVSDTGARVAKSYALSELDHPARHNYGNREEWLPTTPGKLKIITGDFFKRDWQATCADQGVTRFDLIYDYTVRQLRSSYAACVCGQRELTNQLHSFSAPSIQRCASTGLCA